MIIVPELETVFVLVPRTGSGTLYRELMRVYPRSFLLYRHMEADGVPQGYDRWKRVGFVRHPITRLYSLYKFMQDFGGGAQVQGGAASAGALRVRSQVTGKSFVEWLEQNNDPWTVPYDASGHGEWWPVLSRRDPAPENRRSQFSYLRPDLGTTIYKFETLPERMRGWGLDPACHKNRTPAVEGDFCRRVRQHVATYCQWDIEQKCELL